MINYVSKDISEMLPRWDNDEPDVPAKNIVNVMFGAIGSGPKNDVQLMLGVFKAPKTNVVV